MAGIVGVDPGGAEQPLPLGIEPAGQCQSGFAFLLAGAGEHHLHHAGGDGALQKGFALGGEARVGQIDADVDELHLSYLSDASGAG